MTRDSRAPSHLARGIGEVPRTVDHLEEVPYETSTFTSMSHMVCFERCTPWERRSLTSGATVCGRATSSVVDAIATGGPSTGVLMGKLAELDGELGTVIGRLDEVTNDLAALEAAIVDPEELGEALEDLEPIWAELFPKERARVLALLLERIEFDAAEGEVGLTFRPGGPMALHRRNGGSG